MLQIYIEESLRHMKLDIDESVKKLKNDRKQIMIFSGVSLILCYI